MDEKRMFVSVIDDDVEMGNSLYFCCSSKLIFKDLDLFDVHPTVQMFVEVLEMATGMHVMLTFDSQTNSPEESDKYEELVLCTTSIPGSGEIFWYIVTPVGTFFLSFFGLTDDGKLYENSEVVLTDEIREMLYLAPCEAEFTEDSFMVTHVYDPDKPFPPEPPEHYLIGSEMHKYATEYYNIQQQKREREESADTVYSTEKPAGLLTELMEDLAQEDVACVDLINARDGSLTKMYGNREDILADAEEMYKDGLISDYKLVPVSMDDIYDSIDSYPDENDSRYSYAGYYDEYDDYDEYEDDKYCDGYDDFGYEETGIPDEFPVHFYVMRPE